MSKKVIGSELETDKKTNKKRTLVCVIISIILILFAIFGYFIYSDLKQEELLRDEIEAYMELDFATDDYSVEVKTTGDYAIVEEAIKTYFKDMSDIVKQVSKLENDEEFLNILTPQNFKNDGPSFTTSLAKIESVRTDVEGNINKFIEMCEEDYIMSLIEKNENLDSYYVELYRELMYTEEDLKEIQETKEEMVKVRDTFNTFLDDCEEILLFLKKNSGKWLIENDTIIFNTDKLLEEYNALTSKLLENSEI